MPFRVAMPIPCCDANSVTWCRFRGVIPIPWRNANSVTWCRFRDVMPVPWRDADTVMLDVMKRPWRDADSIMCQVRDKMSYPWQGANSVTRCYFRDKMPIPWRCHFRDVMPFPWWDAISVTWCHSIYPSFTQQDQHILTCFRMRESCLGKTRKWCRQAILNVFKHQTSSSTPTNYSPNFACFFILR